MPADHHTIWVEISKSDITHNYNVIKKLLKPQTKIMAVVKANANGHDSYLFAKEALKNGASYLAVARLEEAIFLREKGIGNKIPILIFTYSMPSQISKLVKYNLTQTIYSLKDAKEISKDALKLQGKIKIHIKIDTGMGRLGFITSDKINGMVDLSCEEVIKIQNLKGVFLEGIYSHFASSDDKDKSYANFQLSLFFEFLKNLEKNNIKIPLKHIANSAAAIEMSDASLDMIRLGIAGYGLYPSKYIKDIGLKQILTLKTRITHLKEVNEDFKLSYGSTYKTFKKTKIATISIGYSSGLRRFFSSNGFVLIKGEFAHICGIICMDQMLIDVGHIKNIEIGDEVVIYGKQGKNKINIDDIADKLNTINYEVVCNVAENICRIYVQLLK